LFGGKITVKSTLGEGSTFTVIIPTHAVHETPVEQHADAAKTQTPNSVPPQNRHPAPTAEQQATTPHSPRILIVEDNMINTKLLFHFISEYCPMIDCASTGEFAVELAKTHAFDAILMDINLGSGIDGLQATKLIRKLPGYAETPIVAVTGYTMIGDKERLLAGGCSHYVGKPFTYDTIIGVLRDILPESISATGY
jgi:CheY-like chemotaxis protein